jgi:hypothetical protein
VELWQDFPYSISDLNEKGLRMRMAGRGLVYGTNMTPRLIEVGRGCLGPMSGTRYVSGSGRTNDGSFVDALLAEKV